MVEQATCPYDGTEIHNMSVGEILKWKRVNLAEAEWMARRNLYAICRHWHILRLEAADDPPTP